ncbi:MAG: tetratricopeptide repeat protein [Candidatus Latescibacterota bacterium]|nr:MAG: tetratricopeptide repeat protein [Candidatus Latescibacterota bacterium]
MTDDIKELEAALREMTDRDEETPERVDALNKLSERVWVEDTERARELCEAAYEMAKRLSYTRGIAYSLGLMGYTYYAVSDHDAALRKFLKALTYAEQADDRDVQAQTLAGLAAVELSLGNYEQALGYSFKSLKLIREIGNTDMEAWCLNGIGGGYHDMGDYERALDYHQQSLDLFRRGAGTLGPRRSQVGEARALNGIGTVYQSMGELEKAEEYHSKSLELFRDAQNKIGEARALNDLGNICTDLGEHDKALDYHQRALALRQDFGNKQAQSTSLINLGKLYVRMKDTAKAFDVLHRALTIAMEIRAKPRVYQANLVLSQAYTILEDYSNALDHYKIYQEVKEEVSGDQATARLRNLQVGFEVEASEREAEIARLKNVELREKNDQLERLVKELRETQSELVQSKKMAALGSLVAGLVHEMNTPLGVITSAADVAARATRKINELVNESTPAAEIDEDPRFRRSTEALEETNRIVMTGTERIKRIVDGLKSFARLDEAPFQTVDLRESLETTLALLDHELHGRIEVVRHYDDIPPIGCYPSELNQVFMNLIANAIEAIDGGGIITLRTVVEDEKVHVSIEDTGVGIPEDQMQGLFDPTFSAKGQRVKAGMGLFTCFNIVRKHHGDIDVRSEVGSGSTFTVILPMDLEARLGNGSAQASPDPK